MPIQLGQGSYDSSLLKNLEGLEANLYSRLYTNYNKWFEHLKQESKIINQYCFEQIVCSFELNKIKSNVTHQPPSFVISSSTVCFVLELFASLFMKRSMSISCCE
jgi:hypothetical protein